MKEKWGYIGGTTIFLAIFFAYTALVASTNNIEIITTLTGGLSICLFAFGIGYYFGYYVFPFLLALFSFALVGGFPEFLHIQPNMDSAASLATLSTGSFSLMLIRDKRGVVSIIVAISLVALFGIAAIVVDIGFALVARNELQNVSDAAALAAARQLGAKYETMPNEAQQSYIADPSEIVSVALDIAHKNKASGENVIIDGSEVTIGKWDADTKTLTPTLNQPDAVRVKARRDKNLNGPVSTFFAPILGIDSVDVSATATAALTGLSTTGPGGLPLPVGISAKWFEQPEFCDQPIRFHPTGDLDGCAGWHTYADWPASNSKLRRIVDSLTDGTFESPETDAGEDSFSFTGGTLGEQAFNEFQELFNEKKVLNDGVLDMDDDPDTWTLSVPVYDRDDCSNPNYEILIVGFSTVTITSVIPPPGMTIMAEVKCDILSSGRGSGRNYGTMGSIPGLVQ